MDFIALFGTIHGSHYTIYLTFIFIYNTLSKNFSVSIK